ncbi:MFS transporter [Actinophytocola xinjiangensis]|uniref:MFS transporter n=1 Tax=Actinophytocola xinjiangensis TaxID=485602 RepID=A0A7Z1B1A4_9PSEU|nr:MFS transporter [Actinophytocola xinjiangensis]
MDIPARAGRREWAALAVLSLAAMLMTFDMFVLLLALPDLSADLRPSTVEQLWILDIYGFVVGGFLVTMGTLGDRIGRRRLLQLGAIFFAVASIIAAYAPTAELLIAARALLGLAGATLAPSTLALISNMFRDPAQMGQAIGIWAGSFALGSILGPVVGGFMLAHFWWGSVFLIAVPVMVVLLVLLPILVPEFKSPDAPKLDLASAALSLGAMLGFIYFIKELSRYGLEPLSTAIGLAGVALGIVFAKRQLRLANPMLDLSMFRNRKFSTMLVGLLLYGIVGASCLLFMTQFFTSVSNLSPLQAALCLLPGMVVAVASSMIAPLVARRVRPAYLIGYGLFGVAAAFIWFSQIDATSGPLPLIIGYAIIGLCDGPLVSLGTGLVISAAPPEKAGQSSSMAQVSNEAGAALGVALLGSVGSLVYISQLDATMPADVPAAAADAARENVAGAVAEAGQLAEPARTDLLDVARDAFTSGVNVFGWVAAVVVVAAAVFIIGTLKHVPPMSEVEEQGQDQDPDGAQAAEGAAVGASDQVK